MSAKSIPRVPTKNDDNLQVVAKLRRTVQELEAKLEASRINFNKMQSRLAKALNDVKLSNSIAIDNKELRKVISRKNEALERRDESIKHLRERLG